MGTKKSQNFRVKTKENIKNHKSKKLELSLPNKDTLYFMIAFAVIARLILTAFKSYEGDIAGYVNWGQDLFKSGPRGFYESHHVVYAPFYLYILWLGGAIQTQLSMSYDLCVYMVKLTSDIFDFFGAYLIYRIAKKHSKEGIGFFLAFAYTLNPGVFFNSSIWGQFDGPQATLQLLTIYILESGKKSLGLFAFAIAILTKPQSAILAPVVLMYFVKDIETWDLKSILASVKEFALGTLYSIGAYTVLVLPFYYQTKLYTNITAKFGSLIGRLVDFYLWMYSLYSVSVDDYPYATANAFNVWTLLGGQPIDDRTSFMSLMGLSLTYKTVGLILFTLCVVLSALYFYNGRKNPQVTYFASYFVILSGFFFATRMHERYLLPSIIFLTVSLIWNNKNIVTLILLSAAVTANHWYIYDLSFKKIFWIENYDGFAMIFAAVTGLVVLISIVYMVKSIKESSFSIKGLKE